MAPQKAHRCACARDPEVLAIPPWPEGQRCPANYYAPAPRYGTYPLVPSRWSPSYEVAFGLVLGAIIAGGALLAWVWP